MGYAGSCLRRPRHENPEVNQNIPQGQLQPSFNNHLREDIDVQRAIESSQQQQQPNQPNQPVRNNRQEQEERDFQMALQLTFGGLSEGLVQNRAQQDTELEAAIRASLVDQEEKEIESRLNAGLSQLPAPSEEECGYCLEDFELGAPMVNCGNCQLMLCRNCFKNHAKQQLLNGDIQTSDDLACSVCKQKWNWKKVTRPDDAEPGPSTSMTSSLSTDGNPVVVQVKS